MEFSTEQKIALLSKMGYTVSPGAGAQSVDALIKSQGLENKFKALNMAAGGLVKQYSEGGEVRRFSTGGLSIRKKTLDAAGGTTRDVFYVVDDRGFNRGMYNTQEEANAFIQSQGGTVATTPTSTPDPAQQAPSTPQTPTQTTPPVTYQTTSTNNSTTNNTGGFGDYTQGGYWTQGTDGSFQFVNRDGQSSQASSSEQEAYTNVVNLFQQYGNRAPAEGGLNYYVGQLTGGRSLADVENEIRTNLQGSTTGGTTGGVNNTGGYGDYQEGGYWVTDENGNFRFARSEGELTNPSQKEQEAFTAVNRAFQSSGGRAPELGGLNYYIGQIMGGRPVQDVENEIIQNLQGGTTGSTGGGGVGTSGSGGGQQTGGEDVFTQLANATEQEAFEAIRNTFRNSLGRNIEQGGLDYYMGQFQNDRPLADILNEIIRSEEAQQNNNQLWNQQQSLNNYQRGMMLDAYTQPDANVFAQQVERIVAGEGTLVDPTTGQVTGDRAYDPSTIDGQDIAQADTPTNTGTATYQAEQIGDQLDTALSDLEAQTATPSSEATVRGQLEILMDDFEDGTPPWASGAMRQAMGIMQSRGLGASSIAGQAVVQAAMEAALPIASQDASTFASFEMQNLNNRQQTEIFKAQQRIATLFTDQAAVNAAQQFNASSENQTNQFFASLEESTSRFNAAQVNAVNQINVDAENAAKQFNAQMGDLRDRFNATNSLVIAQANAQWRQQIATFNTVAQNDANMEYAKQVNLLSTAALDQLWQRERDIMAFAFTSSESQAERDLSLLLNGSAEQRQQWDAKASKSSAIGSLLGFATRKVLDWGFG